MTEIRLGRQTPTNSVILPYKDTKGTEAIEIYEESGRVAQEWQALLTYDIMAINDDNLWTHTKFGYSIPRRNGKNEVVVIRELYALRNGERALHTAHRTTTSSSASKRLASILEAQGYTEVKRVNKEETYEKHYTYAKQFGLERITLLSEGGGVVEFRTRTSSGGLGEGFDLLVIDEAQEYTEDQESTLKYVVSDSPNPQIIFCGTPPTNVSKGTVFPNLRKTILSEKGIDSGWAEWSVNSQTDPYDVDAWYETNPSMGKILTERKVKAEIGDDEIDFNIQRLGYWVIYNQQSAISEKEWDALNVQKMPKLKGKLHVGIKYGRDGTNVAVGIAVKTNDEKIFVEVIDCVPIRNGNNWIIAFIKNADVASVVVDGANGQHILAKDMQAFKLKKPIMPTVKEIINAYAMFEQAIFDETLQHKNQPSLRNVVTNCEKRAIGSNGGFGYKAIKDGAESALIDCVALAYWSASTVKETNKQKVSY